MTALRPCKCCGETEHLETIREYDTDWTFTEGGQIARAASGAFAVQELDHVRCLICGTQAPLPTWNAQSDEHGADWSERRAATISAWEQYELAEKVVLDHLHAHTGERYGLLDLWPVPSVPPGETLAILEHLASVAPSGDQPGSIEGIVNSLAGRLRASEVTA